MNYRTNRGKIISSCRLPTKPFCLGEKIGWLGEKIDFLGEADEGCQGEGRRGMWGGTSRKTKRSGLLDVRTFQLIVVSD
ncbi:MAG: hypothetical protein IKR18_10175 [Bacteroidaceae bacterium]|nr:hypothetical protein [Bacteroidaceae bacterium]